MSLRGKITGERPDGDGKRSWRYPSALDYLPGRRNHPSRRHRLVAVPALVSPSFLQTLALVTATAIFSKTFLETTVR